MKIKIKKGGEKMCNHILINFHGIKTTDGWEKEKERYILVLKKSKTEAGYEIPYLEENSSVRLDKNIIYVHDSSCVRWSEARYSARTLHAYTRKHRKFKEALTGNSNGLFFIVRKDRHALYHTDGCLIASPLWIIDGFFVIENGKRCFPEKVFLWKTFNRNGNVYDRFVVKGEHNSKKALKEMDKRIRDAVRVGVISKADMTLKNWVQVQVKLEQEV